ncbi:SDR family NAD(P)-dependent oxidoreductase [Ferrovibrio terrae]|uniref:SDR family NAD(P)-dependent oxidoreductase n=1 Tax=Ferrovibrio terrae TaxID=2594003 RepID=UPI0031379B02
MKLMPQQVAVITGGASGIGLALAQALGRRGLHLALLDIEAPALEAAAESLRAEGISVAALACDVGDAETMNAVAAEVLSRHGHVDLLVNNAGVGGSLGPLRFSTPQDWQWVVNVNLFGVVNGLRAFLPAMQAASDGQGSGHIVNIASVAGLTAPPFLSLYIATKHAVMGLSESLAAELAITSPGLRLSVVCPGAVETAIMRSERNRPAALKVTPQTPPALLARLQETFGKLMADPMPADTLARIVLAGIEADAPLILTHAETAPDVLARIERIAAVARDAAA